MLSIGDESSKLKFYEIFNGGLWRGNLIPLLSIGSSPNTVIVNIGEMSDTFSVLNGIYASLKGNGSTLICNNTPNICTYTDSNGVIVNFDRNKIDQIVYGATLGVGTKITYPDGESLNLTYFQYTATRDNVSYTGQRLTSIVSNRGYHFHFEWGGTPIRPDLVSVTAINLKDDYCDPAAITCMNLIQNWPKLINNVAQPRGGNIFRGMADAAGKITLYVTGDNVNNIQTIRRPSAPSTLGVSTLISYDSSNRVTKVQHNTSTDISTALIYNYSYTMQGTIGTTTVADPQGNQTVVTYDTTKGYATSVRDALNRTAYFTYDASGRLMQATAPEGNATQYTYDARGNVTSTTSIPKSGSPLANITTSSGFDTSCINIVTCNKPLWARDAKGNQTDNGYDPTHGGVISITGPAAIIGGVRPQTRFNVEQRHHVLECGYQFNAWLRQHLGRGYDAAAQMIH